MHTYLTRGLLLAAFSSAAITTQAAEDSTQDDWKFAFSPYFWAAGISGDVGQFGLPKVHTDTSFDNILSDLDFSFMGIAEARKNRFSLFADIVYTKVSSSASSPRGVLVDHVNLKSETFAGLVGGGYAIAQGSRGTLDLVGGVRVWDARSKMSFKGGLAGDRSATDSDTWVDALAGFRGKFILGNDFYLSGWALAGGGAADLDWDVAAMLGYDVSDSVSAVLGYRALGVEYEKDDFVYDVVQRGPTVGLVLRF
ncbi:hypothetical protein [Pseudomonas sp. 5P_3.1_Bac2]|uniref:hypothetical protein n=1 Tax=Pseudomonas sp. 5P_3.1_Bac2 TaxID=2971617 RepID=UPI0021C81F3E|nr:hypothetical protein [Pseudomonas sp. 5P_3.1_Bac2]MCU1717759.1 hypothetical protein [Pseudomonas sp. 5P_3.1_Bac2]